MFDFLRDDCRVIIIPPRAALRRYIELIDSLPEKSMLVGAMLRRCGALTERELQAALARQREVKERKAQEGKTLRVDADRLDHPINPVGELVIAAANTTLLARRSGDATLLESAEVMSRLVGQIRESALRMRRVQIGDNFNRFRRVVRDVSQDLKKEIELVLHGGSVRRARNSSARGAARLARLHPLRHGSFRGRGVVPLGRIRVGSFQW